MNLEKLFEMQRKLDERIIEEKAYLQKNAENHRRQEVGY